MVSGPPTFFSCHGSQRGPATVWLPIFFIMSYFVFNRRKKLIYWFKTKWGWVHFDFF